MQVSSIVVAICTLGRPAGLRGALQSLDNQRLSGLAGRHVAVIVVDNSSDGGAAAVLREFTQAGHQLEIGYVSEKRRGLSFARNAALDAALARRADALAFLDDDEFAEPDWLARLVRRLEASGAAAAIGPVLPLFESLPPRAVPIASYATHREVVQGFVQDAYTGNAVIRLAPLRRLSLRFDLQCNEVGGEDTLFFRRLLEAGERLAWAADARVFERVPAHRMRTRWLLRRWCASAAVEAQIGARGPHVALGRGLVRIGAGAFKIAGSLVRHSVWRPDKVVASFYTSCRGLGFVASSVGSRFRR